MKKSLGKGLDALFQDVVDNEIFKVSIGQVFPDNNQPRKHFDEETLGQLTESIKAKGILQPIIVRTSQENPEQYIIIAGERRWRAAQAAGLTNIPVVVKDVQEKEAFKLAIIENVQREDLNVLEEAEGYRKLIDEYQYTQAMIGQEVGKSRSHIANILRMLNLPEEIKEYVRSGQISNSHARTLINAEDSVAKAREIIGKKLNVRAAEALGKSLADPDVLSVKDRIASYVDGNVNIKSSRGKYSVVIEFEDLWRLEDFLNMLARGKGN